jgi:hypothetical protein
MVSVPAGGQDTQLKEIREMQAKLDEEAGQLVQLQQNIEQEWAGRALAGEARHRARDVQRCIVDDARTRMPPASSGVGQNLAAAAILLRAMPEPSTTEGRRIQGELKISWRMLRSDGPKALPPECKGAPRSIAQRLLDSCGRPRSTPGARGTGRLQPRVASATSHTIATVDPASTRGCAEATTLGAEDTTTMRRIRVPRPNHQVHKPSVEPYDGRHSRLGSGPRVPSPSTRGNKAGVVACGLQAGMRAGRDGQQQPHHPQPPPVPLRRCPGLAGASAACADLQLGRPGQGLRWKFPGHARTWELMGSPKLPPVARGIPVRVHPTVFKAAHRAAQHH